MSYAALKDSSQIQFTHLYIGSSPLFIPTVAPRLTTAPTYPLGLYYFYRSTTSSNPIPSTPQHFSTFFQPNETPFLLTFLPTTLQQTQYSHYTTVTLQPVLTNKQTLKHFLIPQQPFKESSYSVACIILNNLKEHSRIPIAREFVGYIAEAMRSSQVLEISKVKYISVMSDSSTDSSFSKSRCQYAGWQASRGR